MAYPARIAVASAARTVTGNSGQLLPGGDTSFGTAEFLCLMVEVSAASGTTPTLGLAVEWSFDGVTWATPEGTADAFASITAVTAKVGRFAVKAPFYRVVWTIAGTTPSFTFLVRELALNEQG